MTKTENRRVTRNFLGQEIFLGFKINQIFHLLNKKIKKKTKKKTQKISLSTEWITLKSFTRKNKLINIMAEHCFDVTLADFEQIINNDNWKLND